LPFKDASNSSCTDVAEEDVRVVNDRAMQDLAGKQVPDDAWKEPEDDELIEDQDEEDLVEEQDDETDEDLDSDENTELDAAPEEDAHEVGADAVDAVFCDVFPHLCKDDVDFEHVNPLWKRKVPGTEKQQNTLDATDSPSDSVTGEQQDTLDATDSPSDTVAATVQSAEGECAFPPCFVDLADPGGSYYLITNTAESFKVGQPSAEDATQTIMELPGKSIITPMTSASVCPTLGFGTEGCYQSYNKEGEASDCECVFRIPVGDCHDLFADAKHLRTLSTPDGMILLAGDGCKCRSSTVDQRRARSYNAGTLPKSMVDGVESNWSCTFSVLNELPKMVRLFDDTPQAWQLVKD
jgi:hypothetical protein